MAKNERLSGPKTVLEAAELEIAQHTANGKVECIHTISTLPFIENFP